MSGKWHQIKVILWKNYVIRKRHWLLTICEALIPVLLFIFISYGRSQITEFSKRNVTAVTYNEKFPIFYEDSGFNLEETVFYYSPSDDYFADIVHRVQEKFQIINNNIRTFPTEKLLTESYMSGDATTVVAIIFKSKPGDKHLEYTIRLHEPLVKWKTNRLFEDMYSFQPGRGSDYTWKGFLTLQKALDLTFLEKEAETYGVHLPEITLESQEFPYPPYRTDLGFELLSEFLPLITLFSFSFVCPAVLQRVVEEKYTGIKQLMKMVGMKSWALWFGWLIYSIVPMLLSVALIVVLLKVDIFQAGYPPIEYTCPTILTTFLSLYCLTITLHTFFLSTFFEKPILATLVGFLFWILSYFVPKYLSEDVDNLPFYRCLVFMLFPNMALHFGFSVISQYEIRETGLQWTNWYKPSEGCYNDLAMFNVFLMLGLDCILYAVLTLLIDPYRPGKYGIPKHISLPKWLKRSKSNPSTTTSEEDIELLNKSTTIVIRNLSKCYGDQTVVKDVSMDIHGKSITVLLGHNGAGKSTVMGMITGMINKTSGEIFMSGQKVQSIADYMNSVGLCPQHNMFFSDLTIKEHLKFFAMLKGQNWKKSEKGIDELLEKLQLEDKKHHLPHTLSGGMQRKLCLAMAVIGDSKILILDEPSSGMDLKARNDLRNLLLQLRKERTILITTHFMEEAERLADRVIMLNDGEVVLNGSDTLTELKKIYGKQKFLRILIDSTANIDEAQKDIDKKLKSYGADDFILDSKDGNELKYQVTSEDISKLLKNLEEQKKSLHIEVVSVSNPSIEDIFQKYQNEKNPKWKENITNSNENIAKSSGGTFGTKFQGLGEKKFYFLKTKWQSYTVAVAFAGLFLLLSIGLGQAKVYLNGKSPKLELSPKTYSNTTVLCGGSNSSQLCQIEFENLMERKLAFVELEDDLISCMNANCVFLNVDGLPPFVSSTLTIVEHGIKNLPFYQHRIIAASEFTKFNDILQATFLYNGLAIHSAPISLNLITNTLVKHLLGKDYEISASIHPFQSVGPTIPEPLSTTQIGLLWLIILPLGFLFFLGSFIYFPHKEISSNFIQLQYISGMTPWFYWIFAFISDYIIYVVAVTILSTLILLWTPFRGIKEWQAFYVILLLYGINGIPFSYLFSRRKSFSSSYALFVILGLMFGILQTVIVIALEESRGASFSVIEVLKLLFSLSSPHFGLTYWGVMFSKKVVENYSIETMDQMTWFSMCQNENPNPCCFGETEACIAQKTYSAGLILQVITILIGGVCYLLLNILFDDYGTKLRQHKAYSQIFKQSITNNQLPDIVNKTEELQTDALCVSNLKKSYNGVDPVVDIKKLDLNKGECFGILGVNGSGKSTTFRMLTRQEVCDEGSIQICDPTKKQINIDNAKYLESIGYCPQNDALNDSLTGRQILNTIALLRGLGKNTVNEVLDLFGLTKIANMPCGHYSGGNKRKLSFAIAIIGLPDFILLDEPTNGIDPLAKRKLWALIRNIKNDNNVSFILTSHSMEECEALCNKLVIMNGGRVTNNDTILKLKETLNNRFHVAVRLKEETSVVEANMVKLRSAIHNIKGGGVITDEHTTRLAFQVNKSSLSLADLYGVCEKLKSNYQSLISDYAINDGPLEDAFLNAVSFPISP